MVVEFSFLDEQFPLECIPESELQQLKKTNLLPTNELFLTLDFKSIQEQYPQFLNQKRFLFLFLQQEKYPVENHGVN